jgi:hypothetical protein
MHTQAYLFQLLQQGTTRIVTTCSKVTGCPFLGKVLVEVGLIGTGHVVDEGCDFIVEQSQSQRVGRGCPKLNELRLD